MFGFPPMYQWGQDAGATSHPWWNWQHAWPQNNGSGVMQAAQHVSQTQHAQNTAGAMPSELGGQNGCPESTTNGQVEHVLACIRALPKSQQDEVWSQAPATQTTADFETGLKALLDTVVNASCMDENDLRVVANTMVDALGKISNPTHLHHFVLQAMSHCVAEGSVDPSRIAEGVLTCEPVNALLWKAPSDLQPDTIAKLEQGHPAKIAKHQALNRLMVNRIIELQTSDTRKFWTREGTRPIATTSNERDFFFQVVPRINMAVPKAAIQECVSWITNNLPDKYRRDRSAEPNNKRKFEQPDPAVKPDPANKAQQLHVGEIQMRCSFLEENFARAETAICEASGKIPTV